MTICLLSTDWGNVADWAAVVVGVGAAVATTVVAVLAHRTSKRAAEIAEEATRIAGQQHAEAVTLREETARIIGRLLLNEVSTLPIRLQQVKEALGMAGFEPGVHKWAVAVRAAIAELEGPLLPSAELAEDRIHTLPRRLGADLAMLIGRARDARSGVAQIQALVDGAVDLSSQQHSGKWVTQAYSQVSNFQLQLELFEQSAAAFANEFQGFVLGGMEDAGPAS